MSEPFACETRGPKIDDERVAAFEAKLGARLPDDYRQFLLNVNGCVPEANLRVPLASGKGTILQLLYGLDAHDDWMDIESALETMRLRDEGQYPVDALPIGTDGAGNKIVLAVSGEEGGAVFFQNLGQYPERRTDTEWYRTRQFSRIASSFAEFVASLRPKA